MKQTINQNPLNDDHNGQSLQIAKTKLNAKNKIPKHLVICLISLGVPPEIVSRDPKKNPKMKRILDSHYGGTKRSSIYTRFSLAELTRMTKKYFRLSARQAHPDGGGDPEEAKTNIPYLIAVYKHARKLINRRMCDREIHGLITPSSGRLKLTMEDANNIRLLHSTGQIFAHEIAELYDVVDSHVYNIVNNKVWVND